MTEKVKACFERHRRRYGIRRITAELADEGVRVGRREIRGAMKRENLIAIHPKRFVPKTTDSRHGKLASPNLLEAVENQPTAPTTVVVGDITYLSLQNGAWCYLAVWQDKVTRRIIGWAVESRMTDELVIKAFINAVRQGLIEEGEIIQTAQGSQYVSNDFRVRLANHKLRQSMSRRGNCYDNAQAESFFSRFKTELVEDGLFESVEQARSETFDYVEGYYNRIRKHSSLGNKSPLEFEKTLRIKRKEN